MPGALLQEDHSDYELQDGERSVWVTVDNISVYIIRTDEGVVVDLYPRGREADDPTLGSTWALFAEADPPDEEVP